MLIHKDFIYKSNKLLNESLLKTEQFLLNKRQEQSFAFIKHFQMILEKIAKLQDLQDSSHISAIRNIEYTMLYSNFINRQYTAEVWVYGEEWYADRKQLMLGEYDISELFIYFD